MNMLHNYPFRMNTKKHSVMRLASLGIAAICLHAHMASAEELKPLFDGNSLDGWKGADGLWSVQDGAVVGQTTKEKPIEANTFLVWQGGDVADFEFTCEFKFEGNNSGVQYRSQPVGDDALALRGYQADLHPKADLCGMLYGTRGKIATRHQRVEIGADGKV